MRKVDPNGVKKDFLEAVDGVEALTILLEDVPAAARQAIELQLLSAVVYWEGFVTDLFVAYINGDSRRFAHQLNDQVLKAVKNRFGEAVAAHTAVTLPLHLDRASVEALLDRSGRNLSVGSAKDLIALANEVLPGPVAGRVARALGPAEQATMDAWFAIRNFVAHRSHAAWAKMNDALVNPDLPPELRRGANNVNSVGKYLAAWANGSSRAKHIFDGMRTLANRM